MLPPKGVTISSKQHGGPSNKALCPFIWSIEVELERICTGLVKVFLRKSGFHSDFICAKSDLGFHSGFIIIMCKGTIFSKHRCIWTLATAKGSVKQALMMRLITFNIWHFALWSVILAKAKDYIQTARIYTSEVINFCQATYIAKKCTGQKWSGLGTGLYLGCEFKFVATIPTSFRCNKTIHLGPL